MPHFSKYYFIINPVAGNGEQMHSIGQIQSYCREQGWTFDTVITKESGEAVILARQAAVNYEVIVAVGGDGTVNEVATGLVGTSAVLGIIPSGSGNDFALTIGIPKNATKILEILKSGSMKKIDLGQVNGSRYFINGVGVGFDGEAAGRVRRYLKFVRGFWAYLLAVLRTLVTYRFPQVRVTVDGHEVYYGRLFLVATCNGTRYGGGFYVTPMAKIDDGHFDICLVEKTGRWYALRNLPKFLQGKHLGMPEVHLYTGYRVEIESDESLSAHVDGELLQPRNTYIIEILPKQLTILIP
ncbi:MAG: diacylglycerol kinase family protein [Patescibacteria group bacterium]|jgi:YegS/Rv2252/BmrU family lipid kinase